MLEHRFASMHDLALLAKLNRQLIEDEGADNSMGLGELRERMRGWLQGEYRAVIFMEEAGVVAYAWYRPEPGGVHLRQFFVERGCRRRGIGTRAIKQFKDEIVAPYEGVSLEVLTQNTSGIAFWQALNFKEHARTFRMD